MRKHARAERVTVTVGAVEDWVEVVVADDGAGLGAPGTSAPGAGFGMRFMRERAEAAGGSLVVAATAGVGTRVTVRVPRRGASAAVEGGPSEAVSAPRGAG